MILSNVIIYLPLGQMLSFSYFVPSGQKYPAGHKPEGSVRAVPLQYLPGVHSSQSPRSDCCSEPLNVPGSQPSAFDEPARKIIAKCSEN